MTWVKSDHKGALTSLRGHRNFHRTRDNAVLLNFGEGHYDAHGARESILDRLRCSLDLPWHSWSYVKKGNFPPDCTIVARADKFFELLSPWVQGRDQITMLIGSYVFGSSFACKSEQGTQQAAQHASAATNAAFQEVVHGDEIDLNRSAADRSDEEPAVDGIIDRIVHDEPAAEPHAHDAGYRSSRLRLISDERWAQDLQRRILNPSNDVFTHENIAEQEEIRLQILEFSRAPAAFHQVLEEDGTLAACTLALQQEGFALARTDGAKIFVDPREYKAAEPHALGLQSRHVVASERYVETVRAAVRSIKGKSKVHEKREKSREVALDSHVEIAVLINNTDLNGQFGTALRYIECKGRWVVRMDTGGRKLLVLAKNMRLNEEVLLVKNTFIHIPTSSAASVSIGANTY